MSLAKPLALYTVDEYLTIDRASAQRYEYLDGQIYDMAGESSAHGEITINLAGILYAQLKGTPCRGRVKDTKVRSGPTPLDPNTASGLYSYPDLLVICGEPLYHDTYKDIVLNPSVIIEVLSPATESFDRGEKRIRYQKWHPTLTDYVLVSQDDPVIEHYVRQLDGSWLYRSHTGLDASVCIDSVQCTLKLVDVYDRVSFS